MPKNKHVPNGLCHNCGKKIESGLYCSEICNKLYNREPKGAKPLEAQEERNKPVQLNNQLENSDLNIDLILKAIETKTQITLTPRRTHTVKGIPVRFDADTYRVYVDTGRYVESVLLREIAHYAFPKTLFNDDSQER